MAATERHGDSLGRKVDDLTFTPPQVAAGVDAQPDANSASLFTALQEQLGLTLESTRGPVDVLVIDHVEQPTAD